MGTVLLFPQPEPAGKMPQARLPDAVVRHPERPHEDGDVWGKLMARAQDGDRSAYHALLIDITPYLRAIAGRYLGRGEDAEDAVQDILLLVHDLRHTYERARPFKPWLATLASRKAIDLLRRRSRRWRHEITTQIELEPVQEPSAEPVEVALRSHEARTVHDAVEDLSPKQREAIRLVHLEELSLREASERSRQSAGALKVACHRALKVLKQALEKQGRDHD